MAHGNTADGRAPQGGWLEDIHQQWVATLDAIRDALVVIDTAGLIVRANRAFAQLAGEDFAALIQHPIAGTLPWLVDDSGTIRCGTIEAPDGRYFAVRAVSETDSAAGQILVIEDVSSQYLLDVAERTYQQGTTASGIATIEALSNALHAKDPYTVRHSTRVAALSKRIALELGCDNLAAQGVYYAAAIHDLGKLSIPIGILSKPGQLAQVEMNLVRTHCESGYAIVRHMQFPWPVHEVILQHHERIDGSGYPQGLKGDAIHEAARIVAVADVVEAMSSHRPYRAALGIDAAADEIRAGSGHHYDARIVDACCDVLNAAGRDTDFWPAWPDE